VAPIFELRRAEIDKPARRDPQKKLSRMNHGEVVPEQVERIRTALLEVRGQQRLELPLFSQTHRPSLAK
jgi:hypothetical protein